MRCQMYPYLNDAVKYRGWTRRAMIERDLRTLLAAPYSAGQYAGAGKEGRKSIRPSPD